MQPYDIAIAPNQSRTIDAAGNYVYFYAGSAGGADPTILIKGASSGLQIPLAPGQGLRLPGGQRESSWIIQNRAGAGTIIGTIAIGDGAITDNRVTGDVNVIDASRGLVLSDLSYWTNAYQAAVAATFAHCAVWNPAGSPKNLSVHVTGLISGTSVQVLARSLNVQPAAGWTAVAVANRNIGQAGAPVHQLWTTTNAAAQGAAINLPGYTLAANVLLSTMRPRSPFVVKPGAGLALYSTTLNTDLGAHFDVEEF